MSTASRFPAFARFVGIGAGLRPALTVTTSLSAPETTPVAAKTASETEENPETSAEVPITATSAETGEDENGNECDCEEDECDCDDEEMKGKTPAAAARIRENTRCAAIMSHPAAATNLKFAGTLAFNTRLPRAEAIALLEAAPANATGTGLATRMAPHANRVPGPAPSAEINTRANHADFWKGVRDRAAAHAQGSTRT